MPNDQIPLLPTWYLINELMGEDEIPAIKAELHARMVALGATDLFQLAIREAEHSGTPEPEMVDWEPAIVNAQPDDDNDGHIRPLQLKWVARTQKWAATAMTSNTTQTTFGYYPTIAEADAAYRNFVGLAYDAPATEVFVNRERHLRTIVEGCVVPPL
jgi:hypothetical protein